MRNKRKENQSAGLELDKPRILFQEQGFWSQFIFYAVLLLLGGLGALGCFYTAFHIPVHTAPIAAVGVCFALFSTGMFLSKKRKLLLSLVVALAWLGAVWLCFGNLVAGCIRTVNLVIHAYAEKTGFALSPLPLPQSSPVRSTPQLAAYDCTLFAVLLLFPFFWFLGWALIQRKSAFTAFCVTGVFLLAPMVFSIMPELWLMAVLLLFWAMLLLLSPALGRRHMLLEERGRFHASGGVAARPAMLLLLPAAALCMALAYGLFPMETYERPQIVDDIRTGLTEGFGISAMMKGGVAGINSRVDLGTLNERAYTGKTMLKVKYDWRESRGYTAANRSQDYLKCFVGSVYTGNSWERLPGESSAKAAEALGTEKAQNFPSQFQKLVSTGFSESDAAYTLEVENVEANPRCIYTPYGLSSPPGSLPELEFVDDGFLKSKNFFGGTRNYQIDAIGLPQSGIYLIGGGTAVNLDLTYFSRSFLSLSSRMSAGELENGGREKLASLLGDSDTNQTISEYESWKAPQWVLDSMDEPTQNFVRSAENYSDFVQEEYTDLPVGLRETLSELLRANGIAGQHSTDVLAHQIQALLSQTCSYTLSPLPIPKDRDFVEYFLLESKQGYCVHFATAAVALFRAAGVPARYAEGYVANASNSGEWVNVPDYNAHAWAEVYVGGMGWVPVEVTPVLPGSPNSYFDPNGPAPTSSPRPSSPSPSLSPESEESSSPQPEGSPSPTASPTPAPGGIPAGPAGPGKDGKMSPWLLGALFALGSLALLAGTFIANRKLRLRARKKSFSQPDRSKAALKIYVHILRLCCLDSTLPDGEKEPPPELEDLALKARFSQHMLTDEELEHFLRTSRHLETKLRATLRLPARLWQEYVTVLF